MKSKYGGGWLVGGLFLMFACLLGNTALAAVASGNPSSCVNDTSVGNQPWGNPTRARTSDDSYATVTLPSKQSSSYLKCTGFGFAIPSGSTINGVRVDVERTVSSATGSGVRDAAVYLLKNAAIVGSSRATTTAYTTSEVTEAHGGASDLWGSAWSVSEINSANFGVVFSTVNSYSSSRTVSVDAIQIFVDYTPPCTPPSNVPSGLTCVCDNFNRSALNPSPIFDSNWIVSTSDSTGILPSIVNPGYLRLTNNTTENAKAASVPGIFPASGNYISVEFQQFAYNGNGADGMAVTLSDYSVPAVPGAYGGSLGYAQKPSIKGFAGGWIGVAFDEYGNFQNPTESRVGGPGSRPQSVGIRGSGSGTSGYPWLAGTNALSPQIDDSDSVTPSHGYYYQLIVDARNEPTSTSIAVNRDTGSGYASLISISDVYSAAKTQGATQAAVPANWQVSFTGSTGSSTNIHEISGLRICALTIVPPTGGVASSFNAIDEAYGTPGSASSPVAVQSYLTGHIYTKVVGKPFKLNVAALKDNQIVTTYAFSGSNVTVKLVDNSDGVCELTSTSTSYCNSACRAKTAVASQILAFTSSDKGQKQSADFTLNTAYSKLVAIISDSTTTACSTDSFAVRPLSITSVVSSDATNAATGGSPAFKAGSGNFSLKLTTSGVNGVASGYTGKASINNAAIVPVSPATVAGQVVPVAFPAATSASGASTASGSDFTYSEVGGFRLAGYDPASDTTSPRGVYDDTWTAVDSPTTQNDCVRGSYSNTKDSSGKYGCNFGLMQNTATIGRFIPDHFAITPGVVTPACGTLFSYFGQDGFLTPFTLAAQNAANATTQNYAGNLAKLGLTTWGAAPASSASPGFGFAASASLPDGTTLTASTTAPTGTWVKGVASVSAKHQVSRPTNLTGETAVTVTALPVDADGVTMAAATEVQTASTPLRYGRITLSNAFGTEKSALQLPMQIQYWSGKSWVANNADTCTAIQASDFSFAFPTTTLSACETAISVAGTAPNYTLTLAAPGAGNHGSTDIALNLGATASGNRCVAVGGAGPASTTAKAPWLQYLWSGVLGNPSARATFGVYAPETRRMIHVRELF